MTVPIGAVTRPYVQTQPVALMLWMLISKVSTNRPPGANG
jgi:hypothetical protein